MAPIKSLKNIVSAVLLLFVVFSLGLVLLGKDSSDSQAKVPPDEDLGFCEGTAPCDETSLTAAPVAQGPETVVLYYFHRTARCAGCLTIENLAREALEQELQSELSNGSLSFQSINVEEPAQRHFIQQYQITGPTLVLSRPGQADNWKNLDRIWQLLRRPQDYRSYVASETKAFITAG